MNAVNVLYSSSSLQGHVYGHGDAWLRGLASLTHEGGVQAGDMRLTDTRADEAERGITIKSTGISLYLSLIHI